MVYSGTVWPRHALYRTSIAVNATLRRFTMSTVLTARAPSYGRKRGRYDGVHERDGQERGYEQERGGGQHYARQGNNGRRHNKHNYASGGRKPIDASITRVALGPDGHLRQQILTALKTANLGNLPSGGLLTPTGAPKMLADRVNKVRNWLDNHLGASDKLMKEKYSELAIAFAHLARAVADAGLYNQLVALLVEYLTPLALEGYEKK